MATAAQRARPRKRNDGGTSLSEHEVTALRQLMAEAAQGGSIQLAGNDRSVNTSGGPQNTKPANAGKAAGNTQWPGQAPGGQPYPDMPDVPDDKPLLQNLGATGTAIFGGVITSEEYNEDFYWKDGVKIYEQMLRSEAQINAIRNAIEQPIRRATWTVTPASDDPVDIEIASFVQSCLMDDMCYTTTEGRKIHQKWDDTLRHILMHLWFGYMPFEVVWRKEEGWVKWAKWTPLLPRTIWRWWIGEDNELVGVQQWTFKNYNYQYVEIPVGKLLLFVNRQEGNNYEGVSLLRPAYKNWWYIQQFEKIEAIAEERNAVSIPVIQLPEGFTSAELQAAQSIVQNARVNELMGVTLPPHWTFDYPRNQQKYSAQVQPAIQYHQAQMARNILADFLQSTTTGTGSYAQTSARIDFFLLALQSICEYIEDVVNTEAIPQLVDYNFVGVAVYPKIKASKLTSTNVTEVAQALQQLAQGQFVTPDPETEDWLRDLMGMPAAPRSEVQTTNPGSPATPDRPDTQPNDYSDEESQNDNGQDTQAISPDESVAASERAEVLRLREEAAALTLAYAAVREATDGAIMLDNPYPRGPHGHFGEGGMHGESESEGGGGGIHGQGARMAARSRSEGGSGGGSGGHTGTSQTHIRPEDMAKWHEGASSETSSWVMHHYTSPEHAEAIREHGVDLGRSEDAIRGVVGFHGYEHPLAHGPYGGAENGVEHMMIGFRTEHPLVTTDSQLHDQWYQFRQAHPAISGEVEHASALARQGHGEGVSPMARAFTVHLASQGYDAVITRNEADPRAPRVLIAIKPGVARVISPDAPPLQS